VSKVRITGDGTRSGTRIVVLDERGTPITDISSIVSRLVIEHDGAGMPKVTLTLVPTAASVDMVAERSDERPDWTDPRVGEVRRI
jgi:hypothetical protein